MGHHLNQMVPVACGHNQVRVVSVACAGNSTHFGNEFINVKTDGKCASGNFAAVAAGALESGNKGAAVISEGDCTVGLVVGDAVIL